MQNKTTNGCESKVLATTKKSLSKWRLDYLFLSLILSLTTISGLILSSSIILADGSVVDNVSVNVPVSCSMSGTGMNSHTATLVNGTYTPNVGTTTLHAFCNDNEGFAIYAAGYTGNDIGTTNSNKLVGTSASNNATIDTGIATSAGNPDVSNWAMKLTATQDSGDTSGTNAFTIDSAPNTNGGQAVSFSQYHVVPNEYTKVAHKNSNTDMTATIGGVKLTTTYAAYISETQVADTYSGQVIYTLVHPADAPTPVIPKSLDTATTMQEVTYCSEELPEGQVFILADSRDGNAYHVARLADGNCWMLDNLALDPTDSTTAANMNESNTNATSAAISNLLHGGSTTTGWSSTAVVNVTTNFGSDDSYIQPRVNNVSKNTLVTSYGSASTNGQAMVGIYYNFCAASASTYCSKQRIIIDAPQDICPANWRMPTSGSSGEYYALSEEYGRNAEETSSLQYNLSTPLSGYLYNSSPSNLNNEGNWWSSTYSDSNLMRSLRVSPNSVGPYSTFSRNSGLSMRCLVSE